MTEAAAMRDPHPEPQTLLTTDCTCVQPTAMGGSQSSMDLAVVSPPVGSVDDALKSFHPLVQRWFAGRLGEASAPQRQGWPPIREGRNVLIAAPTGSGKTLAAFLACIDQLFRQALEGRPWNQERRLHGPPPKPPVN